MLTVANAFNQMFSRIEPDPVERKRLDLQANVLRDALKAQLGPQLARHFVGGSAGRSTHLNPQKDLDLVFQLDPAKNPLSLANASPEQAMDWFEQQARTALAPYSRDIRRQHRSLCVTVPGFTTTFDLVLLCRHSGQAEQWTLPDLQRNAWIFADPDKQAQALKTASQPMGGTLNRYIRLIKLVRGRLPTKLSSYYLEVMCYDGLASPPASFMQGFQDLCGHLAARVLRRQENPAGLGPNIDDRATPEQRQQRQKAFLELQRQAANAIALNQQKRLEEAHLQWASIFGPVYQWQA